MTELSDQEKQELSIILDEIEQKIKETRSKCINSLQIDILDEIERKIKELEK